jgi:hypothetical protein
MLAILLTLTTFAPLPPVIEVCEINTTPNFQQVILRRWRVRSEGREFWCRSVRYTRTVEDPEMIDRAIVSECDRVPYLTSGK